jgi:cellulose synthase/poly-beta-1,6-N-acetylglucosamine synthase-like glycosyltransferase
MIAAILLGVGTAAALYVMAGYPLLLALRPGRAAPEVAKDPRFRSTVTIILAVHNGAAFVGKKLECLLALEYPRELLQILVVSDGSTDGTDEIVRSYGGRGIELIQVPRGGKAAALNAALRQATGEILFFTDVRQFLEPDSLGQLVANFADPTVGAATGELRILDPDRAGEQADMELYWRYELWARRRHSRIDSIFSVTGCIYAMRRCLAEPLRPDTLTDDASFSLQAFFRGYRVVFDPAAVATDFPTAAGGEFRRKLRTLAGLWQVHVRQPRLFSRANRMRFHFLSHKFARLVLPWAVLLIWAATWALPASGFRTFLLIDELALAVLALADAIIPKWLPLKRISSPAKTFLSMNAAALVAPAFLWASPQTVWKPTRVRVRE